MSLALELLDNLAKSYLVNPELEPHIIIDTERNIHVPEKLKRIAVERDHNIETVVFDAPRCWDGKDLSQMYIYVNYVRADRTKGQFLCKNVRIDEKDQNIMHFDWTLEEHATLVKGKLRFLVCAQKTGTDGKLENHWNSELNEDMHVSEGLECEDFAYDMNPAIITDLLTRMDTIIAATTPILDTSLTQRGLAADAKSTGDAIRELVIETQAKDSELMNLITYESTERKTEVAAERKRIDNIVALKNGSTTGDAELIDARIDRVGGEWNTVGNHIRAVEKMNELAIGATSFIVERIDTRIINGWVDTSGNYLSNATSGDTHKCVQIDVVPGEQYLVYSEYGWTMPDAVAQEASGTMVCIFNTSDSGRAVNDFDKMIVIPDGAEKLTVNCFSNNVKPLTVARIIKSVPAVTEEYVSNAISSTKNDRPITGTNLVTNIRTAYSLKAGIEFKIEDGNTQYSVGECIVEQGKTYVIKAGASFTCNPYIFYDESGVIVGELLTAPSSGYQVYDMEVVAPARATLMKVTHFNNVLPEVREVEGYSVAKCWEGINWACVGDSLTEVNERTTMRYYDYISENTGIRVVNMGVGGTGYKRGEDNFNSFYQRISKVPVISNVVTIFGSGNDLSLYSVLGTPTDTGTDTICGCVNTTIDNLYAILPTVQLGIITPTPWINYPTTEVGNRMEKYAEALVEICKRRGIPCLDLYHCSGLRPWDESYRELAYSKDDGNGVHPDETGHKIIATHIKNFISGMIM